MSSAPDPLWIDDEKVTGFAVCHTSSLRAAEAQRVEGCAVLNRRFSRLVYRQRLVYTLEPFVVCERCHLFCCLLVWLTGIATFRPSD